eukprot:766327-Hanusia_phi.AAC.2
MATYAAISLSSTFPTNLGITGARRIFLHGNAFGLTQFSSKIAIGGLALSSCESTLWMADSSLICKSISGLFPTVKTVISILGETGTISSTVSFDKSIVSILKPSNLPITGANSLWVKLESIGGVGANSFKVRLGATSVESVSWNSMTQILCKSSSGIAKSQILAFTIFLVVSTNSEMISFDSITISNLLQSNGLNRNLSKMTVHGNNFKHGDASSIQARIGDTNSEKSEWQSDSTIMAKPALDLARTQRIVITNAQQNLNSITKLWTAGAGAGIS